MVIKSLGSVLRKIPRVLYWRYRHLVDDWLPDRRLGIRTSEIVKDVASGCNSTLAECFQFYEAVKWRDFRPMVGRLPRSIIDQWVFVDVGAGKGRALVLAAEVGFRCIVGIELSKHLVEAARANIRRYQGRRGSTAEFRVHHCDALTFSLPEEPLVVFLYNPFVGEAMRVFVERLMTHHEVTGLPFFVLYRNPVSGDVLDATPGLEMLGTGNGYAIYGTTSMSGGVRRL